MLKVIKNDLKSMWLPLALMIGASVLIFIISVVNPASSYTRYALTIIYQMPMIICGAQIIYLFSYLLFTSAKWMNIYKLSGVKEMTVIWSRVVLVFAITVICALVAVSERSIKEAIAINNSIQIPNGFDIAFGKQLCTWIAPLQIGLMSSLILSIGLAVISVSKRVRIKVLRYICIANLLYFIWGIFEVTANILCIELKSVDYREKGGYFSGFMYRMSPFFNDLADYSNFGTEIPGINIFSIAELFYTLMFIASCVGICYVFSNRKGGDVKTFLTKSKVIIASLITTMILASVVESSAVLIVASKVQWGDPAEVSLTVAVNEVIVLKDYINEDVPDLENYDISIVCDNENLQSIREVNYYNSFANGMYPSSYYDIKINATGEYDITFYAHNTNYHIIEAKPFLILHVTVVE
jgi:hypothetical protein